MGVVLGLGVSYFFCCVGMEGLGCGWGCWEWFALVVGGAGGSGVEGCVLTLYFLLWVGMGVLFCLCWVWGVRRISFGVGVGLGFGGGVLWVLERGLWVWFGGLRVSLFRG